MPESAPADNELRAREEDERIMAEDEERERERELRGQEETAAESVPDVPFYLHWGRTDLDPDVARKILPTCASPTCGRRLNRDTVLHDGKMYHAGCVPRA